MNNHNFLDYLLVMSLRIKSYKLVGRDYISRMMNEANDDCDCQFCKNCEHVKHIKFELLKKGYQTFNKHVKWRKINHHWGNVSVEPIHDEE